MNINKIWRIFPLLVLVMILTACSEKELEQVDVGEVTRSIFYAPLYAGITEGFFEEEGLEINLTTIPGGDKTMTALLSDGIDIGLIGSETSIYVAGQHPRDPVINFAQLTQTDGTFLVARDETADEFSWDNMKGSTMLGQRVGGMPQMAGEYVLKSNNINPHADLNLIQNVDFANIANAFASGTGDYVQLFEPTASLFEQQGVGHVVASFGAELEAIPYTVFMAKESTLKEDVFITKFTKALYKAQQWVYEASAEEVAKSIAPYFEETDEELIATVVNRYRDQTSYAKDPIIEEQELLNLFDIMIDAGVLEENAIQEPQLQYENLIDTTFAEKAME